MNTLPLPSNSAPPNPLTIVGSLAVGTRDSSQCRVIGLPPDIDKQCNNYKNMDCIVYANVHQGRLRYFEASHVSSDPFGFSGFAVLDDYDSAT
ncbi:hypothetical protein P3L10_007842 [Capsicum annuum]